MDIGEKVRMKEDKKIVGNVFDVGKNNPSIVVILLDEPRKLAGSNITQCLIAYHVSLLERVILE